LTSVVVVGGGVIGSAIAWTLARDGASVMLLERDDVAAHASGVAAGMLQPLGESWGRGGFANLGLRSLAMFPEIIADLREHTGIDPEYHESGALSVAFDDDDERDLRERAATWADHGLEWLDAKAVRTAEPRLAPDARGGLWSPREAHARSALLARAFATGAAQRGARVETGVTALGLLREGRRVTGVRTTAGDRPGAEVVLCQGPWAPMGLDWLGSDASWELPVVPVRGQIAAIEAPRPPLYSVIAGAGIYLVPKQDGSLVVGATQEEVGFDCRVTAGGLDEVLAAGTRVVPALADSRFLEAWAGLRPATPDRLPVIGRVPGVEGLVLATGHFRNGILLSPVTARLVADLVLGKGLPDEAAAFSPARFANA
jgi:glycine oxidase